MEAFSGGSAVVDMMLWFLLRACKQLKKKKFVKKSDEAKFNKSTHSSYINNSLVRKRSLSWSEDLDSWCPRSPRWYDVQLSIGKKIKSLVWSVAHTLTCKAIKDQNEIYLGNPTLWVERSVISLLSEEGRGTVSRAQNCGPKICTERQNL